VLDANSNEARSNSCKLVKTRFNRDISKYFSNKVMSIICVPIAVHERDS